jgi:hypothetical protein
MQAQPYDDLQHSPLKASPSRRSEAAVTGRIVDEAAGEDTSTSMQFFRATTYP